MATTNDTNVGLLEWAKRLDPKGGTADIAEILNERNEMLDDMVWREGNLPTGHKGTVRTGIPTPTWRKMYGGVQPTRSTTAEVIDTCGDLEAFSEIDAAIAELNGNTAAFRLSEDRPHLEGMAQELADKLIYGDTDTDPEQIMGLAPRFDNLTADDNSENVLDGGGSGSDNASIWLVVWGERSCHGIFPKGSMAGIHHEDMGKVVIEDASGGSNTGRMVAYRSHFVVKPGLHVRDWQYIVRIANVDISDLTADASGSSADLVDLMIQALELVPNLNGRAAFYMGRTVHSFLRRQIINATNVRLTMEEVAGKKVMAFDGVPVRRVDALTEAEAALT